MRKKSDIPIPEGICPQAKKYLTGIISVLEEGNIVTSLDHSAIELLGYTYDTYIKATMVLLKEGQTFTSPRGEVKVRPEVRIQSESVKQLRAIQDSFGLNPHARKEIAKPQERKEELSLMDVYLKEVKK